MALPSISSSLKTAPATTSLAAKTPYTSTYRDPSTYYISPFDVGNDPALKMMFAGNDPYAGMSAEDRAYVQGLEGYANSQTPASGGYYSVGLNPITNLGDITQQLLATNDPVAHLGLLNQLNYAPADYASAATAAKTPFEQNTNYTQQIVGSKGTLAGLPTVGYNTPIQLVNNKTGEVVYSGTGAGGLQAARDAAEKISGADGSDANWSLFTAAPGTQDWKQAAADTPDKSGLGIMADLAIPALMLAIPGVGTIAGSALLAAGGSGLSSALQGRSVGDALKMAAITGGAVLGGGTLLGQLGAGAAGATATGALGAGGLGGAGAIATPLTAAQIAAGTAGVAAPTIGGAAAGLGAAGLGTGALGAGGLGSAGSIASALTPAQIAAGTAGVTAPSLGGAAALAPIVTEGALGNTMTVTAPAAGGGGIGATALPALGGAGAIAAPLTGAQIAAGTSGVNAPDATTTSLADKITRYARLAGYGSQLVNAIGGALGDGTGSGATISGNTGALNPAFTAKLPTANIPGLAAGEAIAPRTMPVEDYTRYGFGPEKSFFNNVPQRLKDGGAPRGPLSYEYLTPQERGFLQGYSHGGTPGTSDGRSDDIPAVLSDGEYVIDAETMALLGNGSPRAGAEKMDKWRVDVRKHKGRNLARGKISPNAKTPAGYLAGGRT